MNSSAIVTFSIPVFIILIVIELLAWRKRRDLISYQTKDTAASLAMGFGSVITGATLGTASVAGLLYLHEYRIFDLGFQWWVFAICFFAEDLSFYWSHRLSHEVRWFWASHVIHHSSQHYNLGTALRQPWTTTLSGTAIVYIPIVLLGFPIEMIVMYKSISTVYQFWVHTETIGKLGPLEWFMNTPSHHRVHHATNARYLDRNHAGVLIIWDRLFGTFAEEDRAADKPEYGIVKNLGTFNPLRIAFHEWVAIYHDVKNAPNWKAALNYMFNVPGWSHDGSRQTSEMIRSEWRAAQTQSDDAAAAPIAAE